jgi:hypothetical protein
MTLTLGAASLVALAAGVAATGAAQQATPTPAGAEQHVVAPSLPDKPNKEGVVRPGGSMPTDSEGYVRSKRGEVDPSAPTPAPTPAAPEASTSSPPIGGSPAAGSAHARGHVVAGAPVSSTRNAASTVTKYEKGRSLTVRTPAGRLVKYGLAKGAELPGDLGAGRKVLVETKIVKKRRVATKVSYAEGEVVITNVN